MARWFTLKKFKLMIRNCLRHQDTERSIINDAEKQITFIDIKLFKKRYREYLTYFRC